MYIFIYLFVLFSFEGGIIIAVNGQEVIILYIEAETETMQSLSCWLETFYMNSKESVA